MSISSRSWALLLSFVFVALLAGAPKMFVASTTLAHEQTSRAHGWKRPPSVHTEHADWHTLSGAFYDLRGRWSSRLTINNKGRDETRPIVTLFNADGVAYVVPDVTVPGAGFAELDIAAAARGAGRGFEHGSLQVRYFGNNLQMGAQLLVQDLRRGLQFDEQLSYASTSPVNRLEGVWWRPTPQAHMSLILTNISGDSLGVRARVKGSGRGGLPKGPVSTMLLGPHEMRIHRFNGDGRGTLLDSDIVGGVSVEFDGPHGALIARVLVDDPSRRHSASLPLGATTGGRTSTLHGGGLRPSIGATPLEPILAVRNLSASASVVTGRFIYNRADGGVDEVALPITSLAAGETTVLDAEEAWRLVREQAADVGIGLEIAYSTPAGTVMMSAAMISADGEHVFRIPLIDPETPKSSTGGYPWFADGVRATTIFVKNTTTERQLYLLQISHPEGTYAPGIKELEPGQTVALDVQSLRNMQVPDAFGRTIPLSAVGGQVHWSVKSRTRHAIVGRAEHTDIVHGVSASYACINCCPDTTQGAWIEDDPTTVEVGGTTDLLVMAQDETCYHQLTSPYMLSWSMLNSYSFANSGVATSYQDSTTTGISGGETWFTAAFTGVSYHVEGAEYGWYCAEDEVPIEVQAPVKVQVPTSLSVHTALTDVCSNPPNCQPPGCTGSCAAYYYKYRDYQVMDGASPPQPINKVMTLSETFTTPQNSCQATFVQGQATTNSAGIFRDTFFFFGNSICAGGGTCTVQRNQTWKENSSNNNVGNYTLTYTCSTFSIQ